MKVRFKTISAGPNGAIYPGDVVEVSESEAKLLINGEYAVAVEECKSEGAAEGMPMTGQKAEMEPLNAMMLEATDEETERTAERKGRKKGTDNEV